MGQTERIAAAFIAAVLSIAGILVAVQQGQAPDWGPLGQLLSELIAAGGAAAGSFILMQRIKDWFPGMPDLRQFWIHLGIAMVLSPLAWLGLILLNLTEPTPQGAVAIAGVTYASAKAIYAHYKAARDKAKTEAAEARALGVTEHNAALGTYIVAGVIVGGVVALLVWFASFVIPRSTPPPAVPPTPTVIALPSAVTTKLPGPIVTSVPAPVPTAIPTRIVPGPGPTRVP